ncbi:YCII-related domain-containing protein [Roseomonas rosea]|uniref:YCII-related domain-containing protein n=1 Tax=Muricoccus roseus TaxID=198092 RepID=A0A1M6DFV7_9PROT|nr:YciI family protein [Roseomonas rosea]SHI72227.1 YCII-related domain-containing protein [Roseomonas rosea]
MYFLFRLLAPRPSFPGDMTPEEGALMQAHAAYWSGLMAQGRVVGFGPVADPRGVYGLCIFQAPDAEAAAALLGGDPVLAAGRGFGSELHPMLGCSHPGGAA